MAWFISFNGCMENHLQYNHFELMSIKWTSLVKPLGYEDSFFLVNRSNFCLRNSEGIRFILMRYFKKLYWGSLLLHLENKYLWAKFKVYVCLFTCTRCEPHRERAFYSNLLTSNFLNFLSSKHGKVRTTSYPLREEMRNMMGLNSITNYQSTAFCLDQLRVFGVKMSS